MLLRELSLPLQGSETFFLWGPRQTGKSALLKKTYPDAFWVDLLKADEFRQYTQQPETLRHEILAKESVPFVVIDEIQKVPTLLDEVHWLIENKNVRFALCGSSARKLKQGHFNLLGGRAVRFELFGFVSKELGKEFDLSRALNHGFLPKHYLSERPERLLDAYISDYLKEEIAAEGLVRSLPSFANFLHIASLSDTAIVNFSNVGRECGVSPPTAKEYFQILVDTLLARWLPAYRKRPKRRVIQAPKFYLSDVGVVNHLAMRGQMQPGSELYGKAFENWVMHELTAYNLYRERRAMLSYWGLAGGMEVDFIVNDMFVALEAKAAARIRNEHLKGLRELKIDHPGVGKRIMVCLVPKAQRTDDGIDILPAQDWAQKLWAGEFF